MPSSPASTIPVDRHVMLGGALAGIGDREAGEQHHHLGGDRDAGRTDAISAKTPGSPASRTKCEVSLTSVSEIDARTSTRRATIPQHRTAPRARSAAGALPCRHMRVWIDLTNSPHVLVMRPVIEHLQAEGHEVEVTARDFAQTLALCERFGIAHTAIGRHRGERLAAKATGLASRSAALVRWARCRVRRRTPGAAPALRHRARPRLQRRERGGRAAADPERDDVRLRVGDGAAQRQLPPGACGGGARRDPAGAPGALRRKAASCARYEGLKEEYYLADFEPDPGVLGGAGPRPDARRSSWCARRRRSRSTTASRTTCSRGSCSACARLPPRRPAAGGAAARGRPARASWPACPVSWCPSTRSTRSR